MKFILGHLISGALLGICFHFPALSFLSLIALTPIFYLKCYIKNHKNTLSLLILANLTFATSLNLLTLSWTLNGDFTTGILFIITNSIVVFIPLMSCDLLAKFFEGSKLLSFCFFWISMELLSLNWDLNFPWLILGNLLSNHIKLIQWYEFTGVIGGSIWVLSINILLIEVFLFNRKIFLSALVICVPIILSLSLKWQNQLVTSGESRKFLAIQPNIEPHYEKKNMPYILQMNKVANLIKSSPDSINYLILPETTLERTLINHIDSTPYLPYFASITKHDSQFSIIAGINLSEINKYNEIDNYNSVISFGNNHVLNMYHKNKFIPFSEKIPYANVWNKELKRQFDSFFDSCDLSTKESDVQHKLINGDKLTSLICYEGLFGEYTANLVSKSKTQAIVITSNEGWWNQSFFNEQFLDFVKLRSVENRKWIVKCSNMGISAVINPNGEIIDSIGYNKSACLYSTIYLNHHETIYSTHGDWIGYLALSILFILYFTYPCRFLKHYFQKGLLSIKP